MADLNEREIEKLNVIKKVFIGECTKKEASNFLGLTIRQIDRLLNKFKVEGEKGFVHKNRGKESTKKISLELKQEIVDLYITESDIIFPEAQHKTIKLYNANMKKAIRDKKATIE